MKAFLKEKRIGLRSLWRRGLVILSLFALVFSSCDDTSGGGNNPPPTGKTILEFKVVKDPPNPNYEGLKVDISGIDIVARYAGADWQKFVPVPASDLTKFGVYPKYAQNSSYADLGGVYIIYTIQDDGTRLVSPVTVKVSNLKRSDTVSKGNPSGNPYDPSNGSGGTIAGDAPNYYADGLQLHLDDDYIKEYFVDDYPDFTGISLQGHYMDGKYKNIPLDHDMRWEIRPNYANRNQTGPGVLALTVGGIGDSYADFGDSDGYNPPEETDAAKGVTVFVPLDKVYQVNKIELETPPAITGLLYYETDRGDYDWLDADGYGGRVRDAKIKVTYSNGAPKTKTFTMAEAARQNTVWYNLNPVANKTPITVRGIESTVKDLQNATTAWPKHKNPQITFYYRGAEVRYNMPIFDKFDRIEVLPADGVTFPVDADMTGTNNDIRRNDENWFRGKLKVTAYFKASTAPDLEKSVSLTYQATAWNSDSSTTNTDAQAGKPLAGRNDWVAAGYGKGSGFTGGPNVYTLNFGTPDWTLNPGPSGRDRYEIGNKAWGVSSNPKNNGKTVKVTVSYTPGIGYAYPFEASAAPSAKRQPVDVNWTNIPPVATP